MREVGRAETVRGSYHMLCGGFAHCPRDLRRRSDAETGSTDHSKTRFLSSTLLPFLFWGFLVKKNRILGKRVPL